MWTCPKCGRIFKRKGQMHSCRKYPKEKHFENKEYAKDLYKILLKSIDNKVGKVKEISLPCCIHLFGKYDFIAILTKKDHLEIRFALDEKLNSKRIINCVPLSKKKFKNVLKVYEKKEIDKELMGWLKRSCEL